MSKLKEKMTKSASGGSMVDCSTFTINFDKIRTDDKYITVKFLTADLKVFTQAYLSGEIIAEIKKKFSEIFAIPAEHISFLYKNEPLDDKVKLGHLECDKYGILELTILSDSSKYFIDIEKAYRDLCVPDIITVHVELENEAKDVVVEIENRTIQKPNLGGYKNIKTGVHYHHGFSQTGPPPPKVPPDQKNNRDTQTYLMKNRKTDVVYARATQMSSKEAYIPNVSDKIMTPGPYETADERERRMDVEGKVRTIQRYYRAWKLKKCLKKLSDEYRKRIRLEEEREAREREDDEARKRQNLISKVFPMSSADFAMLYSMVERWKKSELERITSMHCGASKIAEFYLLLEKEIDILRSIESLRNKVTKDLEVKKVLAFFKAIGNPIEWYSDFKGLHIHMDTLENQRGREYFALYKSLCDKKLDCNERLKVYAEIKDYLRSHDCNESVEISKLIDRVCELLARGMEARHFKGLEKRIEAMVLHHFKLVECNENVTEYMRKLREKRMEKNLVFCLRCQQLKTIEAFTLTAKMDSVKICSSCKWMDKAEEPWVDLLPYRFILKQIRNYERIHHAASSVAFILQDKDIHHIITTIWHGHSALSECNDVYQLRLPRWNLEEEWSPWNCILLTAEEAKAHLKVHDLGEVYEDEFVSHVFNKHALAKKHFTQLKMYDRHFTHMAEGDIRLHEDSEYYNRPVQNCLFDL